MLSVLGLNTVLLVYLLYALGLSFHHPHLPTFRNTSRKLHPVVVVCLLGISIALVLFLLLSASPLITYIYIIMMLSLSIFGFALWLGKTTRLKAVFLLVAVTLILLRIFNDRDLVHNLFVFAAVGWLGPFLVQTQLLTQQRFVLVSLIWFLYDIFYVWLTPTAQAVTETVRTFSFPLSIIVHDSLIGTGDLLFASMLLSLLSSLRSKLLAVIVLWGSNVLLGQYVLLTNEPIIFPLLVLWVPLGFVVLTLSRLKTN